MAYQGSGSIIAYSSTTMHASQPILRVFFVGAAAAKYDMLYTIRLGMCLVAECCLRDPQLFPSPSSFFLAEQAALAALKASLSGDTILDDLDAPACQTCCSCGGGVTCNSGALEEMYVPCKSAPKVTLQCLIVRV